jgi:hypothetical protein
MKNKNSLSRYNRLTVAGLLIATVGVVIQILSGHPYPTIPPVFFILLIPAALIGLTRLRWAPILAILGGLFLMLGLFTSGAAARLLNPGQFGDFIGLWIQMLGVVYAVITSIIAIKQNYQTASTTKHENA